MHTIGSAEGADAADAGEAMAAPKARATPTTLENLTTVFIFARSSPSETSGTPQAAVESSDTTLRGAKFASQRKTNIDGK
ncbi:hypothetical protein GCM10025331_38990 [Actinoplanes utahensis]